MIKKLQTRFIIIAMLSMLAVTTVIAGTINVANFIRIDRQADVVLQLISENSGVFPEFRKKGEVNGNHITKETEHSTRYFSVRVDEDNNIIDYNLNHISTVTSEELSKFVEITKKSQKESAYYHNYKYLVRNQENGKLIVFVDCTRELEFERDIVKYSIMISLLALVIIFIMVSKFSKKAIKPVLDNAERQRQFITNAGHELKTPVAIILANADVLELKNGKEDEWVESIKKQANRLDILIKNLLKLAKSGEHGEESFKFSEFNLSKVVGEITDSFNVIAQKCKITKNIEEDIIVKKHKDGIEELITILLDNALKYVVDGGEVNVSVCRQGKNVKIDISNTCEDISKEDCKRFFERFYRKDDSRARKTGGFGIGLSMASVIVENNQGKISATVEDEKIHFITIL